MSSWVCVCVHASGLVCVHVCMQTVWYFAVHHKSGLNTFNICYSQTQLIAVYYNRLAILHY